MKEPLVGCTIAISGDFGEQRPFDKLKQWIEFNGGTATRSISARVTHLVCSRSHWKSQNSVVQAALKNKQIKIVSYDWLEDSLHKRTRCAVHSYLWSKLEADVKTRKLREKTERERLLAEAPDCSTDTIDLGTGQAFRAGTEQAVKDLQSENHHVYRDDTGFLYNITLCRPDVERNRNERHRLTIYESNIHPPFLYACTAAYTIPGRKLKHHVLAERGSQFATAFLAFRRFYKSKTGVDWDYRFHGRQTQDLRSSERFDVYEIGSMEPVGGVPELTAKEKGRGRKKKYFAYILPDTKKGEPKGETGLLKQAEEKYGETPKDLWQVGGEATEDDIDEELENDETESDTE